MSLLRDKVKDAILSLENDEKDWSDFTLQEVAQVVHDQVAVQLQEQIQALQTSSDPAMAQQIQALTDQLATVTAEADATRAELAKHEGDTTESDKLAALQTEADDTAAALSDFFDAVKTANDPAAITAAIAALQTATTAGNAATAGATNGTSGASDATSAGASAATDTAGANTTGQ